MFKTTTFRTTIYLKIVFLLSVLLFLSSCTTLQKLNQIGSPQPQYKYTVIIDESERFVVLPFNNYIKQIEFASKIEGILIDAGLNLVAAPQGTKVVEERKGGGFSSITNNLNSSNSEEIAEGKRADIVRIEKYIVSTAIDAEYIVDTMLKNSYGTIKFTRLSDNKIMSVTTITGYKSTFEKGIMKKLIAMKFVSKVIIPKQPES